MKKFNYEALGTHWQINIYNEISDQEFDDLKQSILSITQEFENNFSRFIKTSWIWKLAEKTGTFTVPKDLTRMLGVCFMLYESTNKKLNPLIGNTLRDLGYDENYSLKAQENIRKTPDLIETIELINQTKIKINAPIVLDFGAMGKGYLVDKIGTYLESKNIDHYLVNGSGDIKHKGPTPIKVGLEDPADPTKVIGTIEIQNTSMCSSSGNRRAWNGHHHIIDPEDATSPDEIIASWVITGYTDIADGLATALFLTPPESLKYINEETIGPPEEKLGRIFEYCLLNKARKIKHSSGFNAEFFSND